MTTTKTHDANQIHKITGIVRELHPKSGDNWSRAKVELDTGHPAWVVCKFRLEVGETLVATATFNGTYKSYDVVELIPQDGDKVSNAVVVLKLAEYLDGVGRIKAQRLSDQFPDTLWAKLTDDPKAVATACGADLTDVIAVGEQLKVEQTALGKFSTLLAKGFPNHIAKRICRTDHTYRVAIESPYKAIPLIEGLGWLTADEVGRKQGIPKDNAARIEAGIEYVYAERVAGEGHTLTTADTLLAHGNLPTLLGLTANRIAPHLAAVLVPVEGGTYLTSRRQFDNAEAIAGFFFKA